MCYYTVYICFYLILLIILMKGVVLEKKYRRVEELLQIITREKNELSEHIATMVYTYTLPFPLSLSRALSLSLSLYIWLKGNTKHIYTPPLSLSVYVCEYVCVHVMFHIDGLDEYNITLSVSLSLSVCLSLSLSLSLSCLGHDDESQITLITPLITR